MTYDNDRNILVMDTPDGIKFYRYVATLHGLRMEIDAVARGWPPTACPTRGRALDSARYILRDHNRLGRWNIQRKTALAKLEALFEDLGITKEEAE